MISKLISKLKSLNYLLFSHLQYIFIFKKISFRSRVYSPLRIQGGKQITIGKSVLVGHQSWLAADSSKGEASLTIKDGCQIGNFSHIYATHSIIIEENVLIADKVYIADNLHTYEDVNQAILAQPIKQLKPVVVGAGCWIGEGVCVIGCSIGRGSVIGANSVVTSDIPDFCVAVGAPARVIKQYDAQCNTWKRV